MAFGQKVNPYGVNNWEQTRTVHSFRARDNGQVPYSIVELRWAMWQGQDWAWLRVFLYGGNAPGVGLWTANTFLRARTGGMYGPVVNSVTGVKWTQGGGPVYPHLSSGQYACTDAVSFGPSVSRQNYFAEYAGSLTAGSAQNVQNGWDKRTLNLNT